MPTEKRTTYGPGGFKPAQPDKNIVEEIDVEIPPDEWSRRQLYTKLETALSQLETAAATPASWAALTPAQKDEAARRTTLAVCKLARLILGRLESD